MKIHELKTDKEYFYAVALGTKTFDVRKNDRDFKVKDVLILRNYDTTEKREMYGYVIAEVTYILAGGKFGIQNDTVVMGLKILQAIS